MKRRSRGGGALDLGQRVENSATAETLTLLECGIVSACRPVYSGSNEVFLVDLTLDGKMTHGVYKPCSGEVPLWDFPGGTLYRRERAAFIVSEALGWHIVPPTVVRDGPYGIGAVQEFITSTPADYCSLLDQHESEFMMIAAFDWLVNNADRKAGHCLHGQDGRIWCIDHGLTFHVQPKLRTVIWDFGGRVIPDRIVADINRLGESLQKEGETVSLLGGLLAAEEVKALASRLQSIVENPVYPLWSGSYRSIPWPPL